MDRLSPLFPMGGPSAQVFFTGQLCTSVDLPSRPGGGVLHLLRQGQLRVEPAPQGQPLLKAPQLLFYPRPCEHRFIPDAQSPPELVCASVALGEALGEVVLAALPDGLVLALDALPELQASLDLLFSEGMEQRCGRLAILNRLFEVVMLMLLRKLIDGGGVDRGALAALADPQLSRALCAMHAQPERPWTVQSLADEAAMSRTAFALHFKACVGQTPLSYLGSWRLARACTLLNSGAAVKRVAAAVGYSSPAAFSRAFAARYQRSPEHWRDAQAAARR